MKHRAQTLLLLAFCMFGWQAAAQQVDFKIDETLKAGDAELPYTLDLALKSVAATRVGVEALLDLRDIQKAIPAALADRALVDGCGFQIKLDNLNIVAENDAISLDSLLGITRFDCGRISKEDFRRGEELAKFSAQVSAVVSVELRDNCAYFKIPDLTLSAPESDRDKLLEESTLAEVKSFLLTAVDLVLSETPLCPELPDELASLDPSYDEGGPREIEDGGLGVLFSGSLDVSPATIIDVLLVLQREGVIPPPP